MPIECILPAERARVGSMSKICKQLSIESPSVGVRDYAFTYDVLVPDVPLEGARVKVICAGACYRQRSSSVSSTSSTCSIGSESGYVPSSPSHRGMRDAAFYPGFEVAGIVESIGEQVDPSCDIKVGDHVIVYPFDDVPPGYAEYMSVPEIEYLVKVPDNLPLSVAAMLPSGALWALNTVQKAEAVVREIYQRKGVDGTCNILVVGTGGLALWALRLARYYFSKDQHRVHIVVACLRDEGFSLALECDKVDVIQWNEDCYEKVLIERTKEACKDDLDIVIDFGTTSRSLNRSMQCLNKGGVVFLGHETAERLMPKFSRKADEYGVTLTPVETGSIEQLRQLVDLVASQKVEPPPYSVFSADDANDVIKRLCNAEIPGRAILQFSPPSQ